MTDNKPFSSGHSARNSQNRFTTKYCRKKGSEDNSLLGSQKNNRKDDLDQVGLIATGAEVGGVGGIAGVWSRFTVPECRQVQGCGSNTPCCPPLRRTHSED